MSNHIPSPIPVCSRHTPAFTLGAIAVVVGLEVDDATQRAFGDDFSDGGKVAVVATILIHGDKAAGVFCELHEFERFGDGGGERFIHQHIAAGE